MVGMSGSGKTCFVYAMYDYMQLTHNGFSFTAEDPDVDLDLMNGWSSIAFEGKWPPGTMKTTNYDFFVQYATKPIMNFSWCDYRGGVLTSRSDESDKKEFLQRLKESSCLIITIGADTVKEILEGNMRKTLELKILNSLIKRFEVENTRRIPIIFALTKADLYTKDEQGKLLDLIKNYFNSLYTEGSGWMFGIVPVTLGRFEKTENPRDIIGEVAPKNIHIPVMFFVASVLKEKAAEIQGKLNDIRINRSQYRASLETAGDQSFWSKILNGDRSKMIQKNLSSLDEEEKNILTQIAGIEASLKSMSSMFKVCKIFFEGKPVDF